MGSPVVAVHPRKSPLSGRRINKPLVEKKRRARINGCLGQLKSLILSTMQTEQGAQVSRLEKADILEMTVKYLRHIQRQQVTAEPEVVAKFSAGYTECATEVIRYMDSVQCVAPDVRSKLETHLVERLRGSVPASSSPAPALRVTTRTEAPLSTCYTQQSSSGSCVSSEINRHHETQLERIGRTTSTTTSETPAPPTLSHSVLMSKLQTPSSHPSSSSLISIPPSNSSIISIPPELSRDIPHRCIPPAQRYHSVDVYLSKSASNPNINRISPENLRSSDPIMPGASYSPFVYNDTEPKYHNKVHSLSQPSHYSSQANRVAVNGNNERHRNLMNNFCTNGFKRRYSETSTDINKDDTSESYRLNTSVSDFLNTFQRPLHIHIPGSSPSPAVTPSPPFLQPHGYPFKPASLTSCSGQSAREEAPPTILYGSDQTPDQESPEANRCNLAWQQTQTGSPTANINFNNRSITNDNNAAIANNSDNKMQTKETEEQQLQEYSSVTYTNFIPPVVESAFHSNLQTQTSTHPHEMRATPSPPILQPEISYTHESESYNAYPQSNDRNIPNEDRRTFSPYQNVYPQKFNNICREAYSDGHLQNRYTHGVEIQNSSQQFHELSDYSVSRSISVAANSMTNKIDTSMTISVEISDTGVLEEGIRHTNNGLSLKRETISRQNDTPLSPPILKKRLLLSQRSESEWMTPPCKEDKRSIQHDAVVFGLLHPRQSHCSWRSGHESRTRLCHEGSGSMQAGLFCTGTAHVGVADDGLWRPW